MNDAALAQTIAAVQAGDRERFREIVDLHQDEVRRFLAARCRTVTEVEELVQSTFVTAYGNLGSWSGSGAFGAWLLGIARNHWRHLARTRQRDRSEPLDRLDALMAPAIPDDDEAVDEGLVARLRRCLQRLPEPHRDLVLRRYGEGLDLDHLAVLFAVTKSVLATRLLRLRQALRQCVEAAP